MAMPITGVNAYLVYGWESSFGSGSGTKDKVFGRGLSISNLAFSYDTDSIYELGDRKLRDVVRKRFVGSMSMTWLLSNPWFFKALLGQSSSSGTAAPYTHTFTVADSVPSMEVEVGMRDYVLSFTGVVLNSVSIQANTNNPVQVNSSNFLYKSVSVGTIVGTGVTDTFPVYTLNNVSVELPIGTPISYVSGVNISISNNAQRIYALGDREMVEAIPLQLDISVGLNLWHTSKSYLENFLSITDYPDMRIVISNGQTGAAEKSITFDFTGVKLTGHGGLRVEPNRVVAENLSFSIQDVTVTAVNDVATVP